MFPLYDSTPRNTFPFINYLLIALNIFAFYLELTAPNFDQFVYTYSFIPASFHLAQPVAYLSIITSIFLHGGFLHIISNMWFLHIFGDNVEDVMGHFPYLIFYLLSGVFATLSQYFLAPDSTVPMIGASGAISAVAGAYFVWFKGSTVKTLIPLFIIWDIIDLPVWFFLGYWFVTQVFSGFGSIVSFDVQGGVAWFAHIGGFLFGYLFASVLLPKPRVRMI
jgi:membrane associated rhomboid family serine protease